MLCFDMQVSAVVCRSSVLAMAYMLLERGWTALETIREFRRRRDVRPNDDFLAELAALDTALRRARAGGGPAPVLHTELDCCKH